MKALFNDNHREQVFNAGKRKIGNLNYKNISQKNNTCKLNTESKGDLK